MIHIAGRFYSCKICILKLSIMKKTLLFVALATSSLFFYSCSKQDLSTPVAAQQSVTSQDEQDAITRTTPAPGNYNVKLYIDDNDTSTRVFRGYVFNFRSNGILT